MPKWLVGPKECLWGILSQPDQVVARPSNRVTKPLMDGSGLSHHPKYIELPASYDCCWYCLFQTCLPTLSRHFHSAPLFWGSFMHGSQMKHSIQVCSSVLGILQVFSLSWVSWHSACEMTTRRERQSQLPWVELPLHESQKVEANWHSLWHCWHQPQESECQWLSTIACTQYIHSYKPPKWILTMAYMASSWAQSVSLGSHEPIDRPDLLKLMSFGSHSSWAAQGQL